MTLHEPAAKPPATPRANSMSLRLSGAEKSALEDAARRVHLPVAAWVRGLALEAADRINARDKGDR